MRSSSPSAGSPSPDAAPPASSRAPSNSLLTGPIAATLVKKSLPVAAGSIAMMLFNLVDAWFIARLGTQPLAAISFTFPVSFTVISLAIGLAIGTSAVVGRRLGRGEVDTVRRRATDALLLALLLGVAVTLVGQATVSSLFTALGADQALMPYIHDYMGIWYLGAIFVIAPRVLSSVLRAQGNTLVPGLMIGAAAILNGLLDPLLIFGWGPLPALGVGGAALATVISWSVMTLALLIYLRAMIALRDMTWSTLVDSWRELGRIALPAAVTSVFTPIAMALVTRIVADYGHAAVAAFGVGTRIDAIAQIAVLSLSMTLSPFVSQNHGAGRPERVKRAILGCFAFVLIWQLGVWGALQVLAPWLTGSYAETPEVGEVLRLFLWLVPLGLGAQGVVILANSSFNALHRPRRALELSVVRLFVLFVPLAWLGGQLAGPLGIFLGMMSANFVMALISWWQMRRTLRRRLEV
ncbi:putative efflux protein, MATE family [Modicisalibacter ilicicola DSM 19980]|uniref:Putative efflux protein, MATE family n=1 Tax=Modicisalibacter ilicicola DSM 19980 TaxID=1121942 RepID=A0A1M4Z455_9GAMM|nr:MATE family efflux transporter [Halomonas ilicicola]SHF12738.1 putative efflux protein, MATE family [Halomonas ilicicola DSM 19980]